MAFSRRITEVDRVEVIHKKEESLTICGGRPVRGTLLSYGHQQIDDEDINAVVEALRSDWITTGLR